jgi:hypothetical protein
VLKFVLIGLVLWGGLLGCRLQDYLVARRSPPTATPTELRKTATPGRTVQVSFKPSDTPTPVPTDTLPPTVLPSPTTVPTRAPTKRPPPTPTPAPTPIPQPTRCPEQYCIQSYKCEPNQDTFADGHVYENGQPRNGLKVRISIVAGGYPIDEATSGDDPLNRKQDPNFAGYFRVAAAMGEARAGNWHVFIVDAQGKRISQDGFFNTQDNITGTSCQHAIFEFVR